MRGLLGRRFGLGVLDGKAGVERGSFNQVGNINFLVREVGEALMAGAQADDGDAEHAANGHAVGAENPVGDDGFFAQGILERGDRAGDLRGRFFNVPGGEILLGGIGCLLYTSRCV